jgi:DHA2 family multidrug resistance protein-like MFS transporter
VIALGLGLGAVGFAVQAFVSPSTPVVLVAVGLSLASFGMAFPMALLTTLLMAATPPDKAGAAAAVNETAGEFGIAVGIATLGTLATVVFRVQLGSGFDSLAAALSRATELGGDAGAELADAARAAYSTGYDVVAAIGVAIFVGMAIVALTVLRRRAPGSVKAGTKMASSPAT